MFQVINNYSLLTHFLLLKQNLAYNKQTLLKGQIDDLAADKLSISARLCYVFLLRKASCSIKLLLLIINK